MERIRLLCTPATSRRSHKTQRTGRVGQYFCTMTFFWRPEPALFCLADLFTVFPAVYSQVFYPVIKSLWKHTQICSYASPKATPD